MSQILDYALKNITVLAAIGFAVWVLIRSRTPDILKGELMAWREKAERLERDNHNLIKSSHLKDIEIADLKSKTDLNQVLHTQEQIIELCTKSNTAMIAGLDRLNTVCSSISKSQVEITRVLERIVRLQESPIQ